MFGASRHDCNGNIAKGNSKFSINTIITTFQIIVTRCLPTGAGSILPDSEVLLYVIFAMVFASCFLCDDSGVSGISFPHPY